MLADLNNELDRVASDPNRILTRRGFCKHAIRKVVIMHGG